MLDETDQKSDAIDDDKKKTNLSSGDLFRKPLMKTL